jgi:hypothetical protein
MRSLLHATTRNIRFLTPIPNLYLFAFSLALIAGAGAQQFVYPAKEHSPQKQKSDEAACYSWAVQQTGFDPV